MFRRLLKRLILLGFICLTFGVGFWLAFTWTLHSGRVRVPNLKGLGVDEVEKILKEKDLHFVLDTALATASATIQPGLIARQDPAARRIAVKGATVHVGISLGTPHIAVPSFIGKEVQECKFALNKHVLTLGTLAQMPYPRPSGTVIAQDPPPGTLVTRNTPVNILTASPVSPFVYRMPNCLGKRVERIRSLLQSRNISISGMREMEVPYYPDGIILNQFPLPGHPVRPGDIVSFTINRRSSNG